MIPEPAIGPMRGATRSDRPKCAPGQIHCACTIQVYHAFYSPLFFMSVLNCVCVSIRYHKYLSVGQEVYRLTYINPFWPINQLPTQGVLVRCKARGLESGAQNLRLGRRRAWTSSELVLVSAHSSPVLADNGICGGCTRHLMSMGCC